jgi:hypothetical protein
LFLGSPRNSPTDQPGGSLSESSLIVVLVRENWQK